MQQYDILIPIQAHQDVDFGGASGRHAAFNRERAFSIRNWAASLHATDTDRYIIVRTNCSVADARAAVEYVLAALPFASVVLDVGLRPVSLKTITEAHDPDLTCNCLFPAATMPRIRSASSRTTVRVPITHLSDAFREFDVVRSSLGRAAEVFADIDFETGTTSRFILLATVLELLATRAKRDDGALQLIDGWISEAKNASRPDLGSALRLMRDHSIGRAIKELVESRCREGGCTSTEATKTGRRALQLYGRRSAVVHAAATVSSDEIKELRKIVRMVLVRSVKPGVFSDLAENLNMQTGASADPHSDSRSS